MSAETLLEWMTYSAIPAVVFLLAVVVGLLAEQQRRIDAARRGDNPFIWR